MKAYVIGRGLDGFTVDEVFTGDTLDSRRGGCGIVQEVLFPENGPPSVGAGAVHPRNPPLHVVLSTHSILLFRQPRGDEGVKA